MGGDIVDRLLRESGFELRRTKKHKVYRRDDGKTFVAASTASDVRAEHNSLRDLCRLLGLKKAEAVQKLQRRKKPRHERVPLEKPGPSPEPTREAQQPESASPAMPSKANRRLAKRLERIERNDAAKTARFAERWEMFMKHDAVLWVPTNEFRFMSKPVPQSMLDELRDADEGTVAKGVLDGKAAFPRLMIHKAGSDDVTLVFGDGSHVTGSCATPPRMKANKRIVARVTPRTRGDTDAYERATRFINETGDTLLVFPVESPEPCPQCHKRRCVFLERDGRAVRLVCVPRSVEGANECQHEAALPA